MSCRAALRLALWLVWLGLLGGCGSLPFEPKAPDDELHSVPVEPKRPPQFRLEIDAPGDLRTLLLAHLDLARLQFAAEADTLTRSEIDRLIGAGTQQALSLLETEGYFNPIVKVERVDDGAEPALLRMRVVAGPRALIDRLTFEVQGALGEQVDAGNAEAAALLQALQTEWALQPGRPFQQSVWDSAKNAVLATLRSNAYLSANWSGTAAQVNADANTVRLFLVADSGALFRAGEIRTAGLQRYDERAVLPVARELVGRPATEQLLRDVQDRILGLGLFESAILDVDQNAADPASAPVLLALRELPLQQATVGVGYADDTGLLLSLEHVHRRVFDTRWTVRNKLQIGQNQTYWIGDLISHLQDDGYRTLFGGQAEKLFSDDETRYSWYARAGRTRDTVRIWRLYYGEYTRARLETKAGITDSEALSGNYHWTWRDVDDLRTPTRGTVWSLQGGLGYAQGTATPIDSTVSTEDKGPFARLYGRVQGYLPLGNSFYGSGRLELGQVFTQEALTVPDTLLFRAGGDDSVRGYAYRTLGPEINGATFSGSTLFTGSLQLTRPIFADQPSFLWALFVDAGNASDGWKEMRPVFGYGVGLHWRSPVGPLRLDLAYGQEVQRFRLHFSVGVVF
jgi:translocation and assembly module TamA